jgi:hypothetical protein
VQDFDGLELNQIRYHEGFLGQRIGPVSCLAFHPYHTPFFEIRNIIIINNNNNNNNNKMTNNNAGNRFRLYLAAGATDSILSIYTHAHNKTYYE